MVVSSFDDEMSPEDKGKAAFERMLQDMCCGGISLQYCVRIFAGAFIDRHYVHAWRWYANPSNVAECQMIIQSALKERMPLQDICNFCKNNSLQNHTTVDLFCETLKFARVGWGANVSDESIVVIALSVIIAIIGKEPLQQWIDSYGT